MNIGSVGSSQGTSSTQTLQRKSEATEAKKIGPDNDGDADDGGAKKLQSTPTPSVNTSGQAVGQVIDVKA